MSLKQIHQHFAEHDPKILAILKQSKITLLTVNNDPTSYFAQLSCKIIGQQLSGRVAEIIETRFLQLFTNRNPTPDAILSLEEQKLRAVGFSWAKVRSIKDLATKTVAQQIQWSRFSAFSNAEIIDELITVKGIGRWTTEMFLIFTLGRENVFSFGDLGLKKGFRKVYSQEFEIPIVEKKLKKWAPYQSYASLALWRALEL